MKDLRFEKPMAVLEVAREGNHAKFVIRPLERGYGLTLGNSLRRVLLSSLPGAAIVNVKIDGIEHEFSTIPGVYEDVMGLVLNLKKVIITVDSLDPNYEQKLELYASGSGVVKAGDFSKVDGLTIINPDLVIANLSEIGKLSMEVTVRRGCGYVSADNNKVHSHNTIGVIAIDSIYTPVERASYHVEKTRGDMDELSLEIETNGAILAKEALATSAKMLADYFNSISEISEKAANSNFILEAVEEPTSKVLEMRIEQFDFKARLFNSLKRDNIATIGDVVKLTAEEAMSIRSLGRKSFQELKARLTEHKLDFKNSRDSGDASKEE